MQLPSSSRWRHSAASAASSPVLGYDDARHLLARTGFGPDGCRSSRLRGPDPRSGGREAPAAKRERRRSPRRRPRARHVAASAAQPGDRLRRGDSRRLRAGAGDAKASRCAPGGCEEMLVTPSPLTERMTLFWHNHFVSGQAKVRSRAAHVPAERHAARACHRQLRRAAARDREGSGDARLSRRRAKPQRRAEREFRARGDGALHARRGPLHRART